MSTLTNDTRLPPQAAILGTAIFVVGIVSVVLVATPWREPPVLRSFGFWGR